MTEKIDFDDWAERQREQNEERARRMRQENEDAFIELMRLLAMVRQ